MDENIVDYVILIGRSSNLEKTAEELKEKVNKHLSQGWIPLGGVSITDAQNYIMIQAMVKVRRG